MPRPRFEKLPAERRREILEAAARELAFHGYDGATLNHILEEAGLSKGAAYYYFDDKSDLAATVFLALWDEMIKGVKLDMDALSAETFWPSLQQFVTGFMGSAKEEPWVTSAAKAIWTVPPEARSTGALGKAFETMFGWLTGAIRRGQALGVVRSDMPEELLLAMALGMDEASDRWILDHWETLGEAEVKRLWGIAFSMWQRMLAPEGA